ncbi:MAG: DUF4892 domain-containing protein [Bacteroidia bacterium]|nr:DUF4892 domain-containing protein [Bacteroidia bacterium]
MNRIFILSIALISCLFLQAQKDAPGSQDHPSVSRFKGSFIMSYAQKRFDVYRLALGPVTKYPYDAPEKYREISGTQTLIIYRNPKESSAFEVMVNYETALKQAGFEALYNCQGSECGKMHTFLLKALPNALVGSWDKNQRYQSFIGKGETGEIFIALYTAETSDGPYTILHITETTEMETGQVSARQLGEDIDGKGKAVLYSLYFETGKANLLPTAEPALAAIADLLRERPLLACYVVGHTDNTGTFATNLELSQRRAEAVTQALISKYGISAARLIPKGVSSLAPVTTNDTETGRSLNRRVELVKQ